MDYYGTAGGGEKHDEYHRPLPDPQAQPPHQAPQAREAHEGMGLPSPNFGGGQWTPPPAHEEATQLLPPYPAYQPPGAPSGPAAPAPGDAEATQYLPPQPPAPAPGSGDATQLLPPQAPAPGPAQGPGQADESTTVLRQVRRDAPGAEPVDATQRLPRFEEPPAQAPFASQAPQGYPRQPPQNDFAHLYRQDGPPPAAPAQAPMFQGYYDDEEPSGPGRRLSTGTLVGIVVVGCAVVGLLVGAVLSFGGDGDAKPTPSGGSARRPAGSSPSAAAPAATTDDAAKQQAVQLDALLKESGTSRSSVIQAVADIKACRNLGSAASDLRAAADQRNDLVSRLGQLSIDKLDNHQALGASLNRAWQASAAADTHYAAWADQVAGRKGCKGGQARFTGQTAEGNTESGTATQAKKNAVRLWNAVADEYGLTRRTYTQL